MPSLRSLSGSDVAGILKAHGFVFVSQKGSHMKYSLADDAGIKTVIVPNHKELRIGTLSSIIRQSGLPRNLFEK